DRRTVVALTHGKKVYGWDWETGEKRAEFDAPDIPEAIALDVFPDGRRVAVPGPPGFISVREWPTGNELRRIELAGGEWVATLAVSPNGKWLAVVGSRGKTYLWDAEAEAIAATLPAVPGSIGHAVGGFSPDGRFLAVGTSMSARVWAVGAWS